LTPEGLNTGFATNYYSRILFMQKLVPLLNRSADARIISVLSAGEEGPIITSDFGITDPKNNSFSPAMRQSVSMMSLCMHEMSLESPKISFIHTFPGLVSSPVHEKWAATMKGSFTPLRWLVRWIFIPIRDLVAWTPEDAGQTGFYEVTSERFAPGGKDNFFRLTDRAEEAKKSVLLETYLEAGMGLKTWEHTLGVFEKIGC
jgi:NAD(P)-dependent dehydrogenase (short-subunit alcohol dehydrogenase family)